MNNIRIGVTEIANNVSMKWSNYNDIFKTRFIRKSDKTHISVAGGTDAIVSLVKDMVSILLLQQLQRILRIPTLISITVTLALGV